MQVAEYKINSVLRCGEMPLFLVFYHNRRGRQGQCIMLCRFSKIKKLLRERHAFQNPSEFGHVIYNQPHTPPSDTFIAMLKTRYGVDMPPPDAPQVLA